MIRVVGGRWRLYTSYYIRQLLHVKFACDAISYHTMTKANAIFNATLRRKKSGSERSLFNPDFYNFDNAKRNDGEFAMTSIDQFEGFDAELSRYLPSTTTSTFRLTLERFDRGMFALIRAADASLTMSEPESQVDAPLSGSGDSETTDMDLQSLEFCPSSVPDSEDPPPKCSVSDCFKYPQARTPFCIAHGGGRRCTVLNCTKAARDRLLCVAHGGGRRCDKPDCDKSAVGGSSTCSSHGGGKKCSWNSGCTKSAQSATPFCVTHGGGKRCTVERCLKVARGKTLLCSGHGGGSRCSTQFCGRPSVTRSKNCRMHTKNQSEASTSSASSSDA